MGGKAKKVKAPEANYSSDINKYVGALGQSMPQVLGLEQQYRPQWMGLNLGDMNSFMNGAGGQQGIIGQGGAAIGAAGQQINDARGQELGSMTGQTGAMRGLLQGMSPEGAARVAQAQTQAQQAFDRSQSLTMQEARDAQQFALETAGSNGRFNDTSTMAAQILNRDNILGQKRQEAYGIGQQAAGMANSFYSAPGMQALSAIPNAYQAGQSYLGMGMGGIGAATPQMVDIGQGFNLGAADRQNQLAAATANAQAKSSRSAGLMGAIGGIAGGLLKL